MEITLNDVGVGDLIELIDNRTAIVTGYTSGGLTAAWPVRALVMSPPTSVGHIFVLEESFVRLLFRREDVVKTCLDLL